MRNFRAKLTAIVIAAISLTAAALPVPVAKLSVRRPEKGIAKGFNGQEIKQQLEGASSDIAQADDVDARSLHDPVDLVHVGDDPDEHGPTHMGGEAESTAAGLLCGDGARVRCTRSAPPAAVRRSAGH